MNQGAIATALCAVGVLVGCGSSGSGGGSSSSTGSGSGTGTGSTGGGGMNLDCGSYATTAQVESAFGITVTSDSESTHDNASVCNHTWMFSQGNIVLSVYADGTQSAAESGTQSVCPGSGFTVVSSNISVGDGSTSCSAADMLNSNCVVGEVAFSQGSNAALISFPGSGTGACSYTGAITFAQDVAANL